MWMSVYCLIGFSLLVLLPATLWPATASADGISLLADLEYTIVANESTNKQTGTVIETDTERFSQLYSLNLYKNLSPFLIFNAGGIFELSESESETNGFKRTSKNKQIRPNIGLELNNPIYRASVDYRKSELTNSGTGIAETQAFSEDYTANFTWRPSDLPTVNMAYIKTFSYDKPQTRDSVNDAFNLATRYDYKQYKFDFNHTRNDNHDKLTDFKTLGRNSSGGVRYSDNFLNDGLAVTAGVKLDRTTTEFKGSGERLLRTVPPGAGFYLLNDPFPDGNLPDEFTDVTAASPFSSINIGSGGGTNLLSFGLFFSRSVEVDVIRLPLVEDPQDPTIATPGQIDSVEHLFSWTLYASDDQLTWTEVPIASVVYDQFDNRFEIRPTLAASNEYFKVVTRPLDQIAPGRILLRDVQALTVLRDDHGSESSSTDQHYNLGLDYRLSSRTSLGYDTYLQQQDTSSGDDRRRWSHGVNLRHRFNRIFSGSSRLLRAESWQRGSRETTNHNFSASLRALYLKTFNQTLTYSLNHTDDRQGESRSDSIVLRSNLDVYRGFSLSLDQGYSWKQTYESTDETSFFLRGRSHIVPHRRFDLNLDYAMVWNSKVGEADTRTENGRMSGFWLPLDTLSLSADISFRITETLGEKETRLRRDYVVAWSPLLKGDLKFSVIYSQTGSNYEDKAHRLSGDIRWRVTSYALLTLSHSKGTFETAQVINENESTMMNLRIYY